MPSVGKSIEKQVVSFTGRYSASDLFIEGLQLGFQDLKQVTASEPAVPYLRIHSKETTRKV